MMIEFNVEPSSVFPAEQGFRPTHKIVLKQGCDASVFWYVQEHRLPTANDPCFDHGGVDQLFAQSHALRAGDFLYFSMGGEKNYYLHRIDVHRFILKALA